MGNLQLTLQAFLTGGGGLQVADVLLQGMQHVGEGITQLEQLVLGAYLRQRRVEITLCDADGRFGKLL